MLESKIELAVLLNNFNVLYSFNVSLFFYFIKSTKSSLMLINIFACNFERHQDFFRSVTCQNCPLLTPICLFIFDSSINRDSGRLADKWFPLLPCGFLLEYSFSFLFFCLIRLGIKIIYRFNL